MFLSKLKITVCVPVLALLASSAASGVAHRATAQETKQAAPTGRAVGQSATAELEALRLEIKALRLETALSQENLSWGYQFHEAPHERLDFP